MLNLQINRMIDEKAQWQSLAMKVTSNTQSSPGGGYGDSRQSAMTKVLDIEREIDAEVDKLIDLRNYLEQAINQIDDEYARLVLQYRYIDNLSWSEITERLHYDSFSKGVFKKHGKALSLLQLDTPGHLNL